MIEGQQQLRVQIVLPEETQEVQPLLSLLYQDPDVVSPGVVCGDVGAQKPEGVDSLHLFSVYKEGGVILNKEVSHDVLILTHLPDGEGRERQECV